MVSASLARPLQHSSRTTSCEARLRSSSSQAKPNPKLKDCKLSCYATLMTPKLKDCKLPGMLHAPRSCWTTRATHCKLPGRASFSKRAFSKGQAASTASCQARSHETRSEAQGLQAAGHENTMPLCKFLGKIVRKAQGQQNAWQGHVVQTLVEMVPKG